MQCLQMPPESNCCMTTKESALASAIERKHSMSCHFLLLGVSGENDQGKVWSDLRDNVFSDGPAVY